jgi:hypothetical protein
MQAITVGFSPIDGAGQPVTFGAKVPARARIIRDKDMLGWLLVLVGFGLSGQGGAPQAEAGVAVETNRTVITATPNRPKSPDRPAAPAKPKAPATATAKPATPPKSYVAEPQVPTGKFTTATEIKPIMAATQASWVAVREFNGQDLVYVTQIMAWRCGLAGLQFAVNGGQLVDWPLPPCHIDTAAPNALTGEDGLPYRAFALGSVQSVQVKLIYDDLTEARASFERKQVLMP